MFSESSIPSKISRAFLHRFMLPLVIVVTVSQGNAQSPTDGGTPLGLAPGAPAGSYSLSDFERLNLYNGSLSAAFRLLHVGGRGAAGFPLQVPINTKWQARKNEWFDEVGNRFFSITPEYNAGAYVWTYGANYSAGSISIRFAQWKGETCNIGSEYFYTHRWARTSVVFTAPDGTEHELVDQATLGRPTNYPSCSLNGNSRGTLFVSTSDPGLTFISDAPIRDVPYQAVTDRITGVLKMPDGTTYRFDAIDHNFQWGSWHTPIISWIRDPNGNKTTFIYTNDAYGDHLTSIKDSLNREVTIEYGVTEAPYGAIDRLTFKGFGGANRVIRISSSYLSNALRPGSSIQTLKQLFPELDGAEDPFDPSVVSAIWLPDSDGVTRRYRLLYNSYGELARVELPTGGAFEYDWGAGLSNGPNGGVIYPIPGSANPLDLEVPQIYRRVIGRRSYDTGNALLGSSAYSRPESRNGDHSINNSGYVTVIDYDAAAQPVAITNHLFYGSPATSFFAGQTSPEFMPTHSPFAAFRDGHEYQTDQYALDGQTLLRRTVQSWDQNPVFWWYGTAESAPINCPFVKETVSTLADSGQVTKSTKIHPQTGQTMIDPFGNTTDVWVYDYGQGQPGALLRHTHAEFLTVNPVNGVDYTNRTTASSPHILNLPTRTSIYDATGTERARSTIEYDNYVSDANHNALVDRQNMSGFDYAFWTGYSPRGNSTASFTHVVENGSVTGSIATYSQYDIAGNIVRTIDGRGFVTNVDYRDNFGGSDDTVEVNGEPTNNPPPQLAGMSAFAFPFSTTNALGHIAYSKIDYYLGTAVAAEDANGVVHRGYFNDALDRPTQAVRGANQGAAVKNQTTFSYDDVSRIITTTTDQTTYADNLLKSQLVYDGLGRTIEKRQYETSTTYVTVRQIYDGPGRTSQASSPFRSGEPIVWTTTAQDALGRVTSVTTPDNAVISSSYFGSTVTATDQAGKQRRSVSDAAGRLRHVYDDPNGLNQVTSYGYDALDNMTTVTQDGQSRTFVYDSMKRLVSASHPENGTTTYQYDNSGNLTHRTDARVPAVTTTITYDGLRRVTSRSYNDGTPPNYSDRTPTVTYAYDGAIANGKGRLASVSSSVSTFTFAGYDGMGRAISGTQTIGSQNYVTSYTYDLAGHVKTITYPSGRAVTYNYNSSGRLADQDPQNLAFTGNLGDGVVRTYSSSISYASSGGLSQERFGTNTPLYQKRRYNVRSQLYDVRVSTLSQAQSQLDWNRGFLAIYYGGAPWGESSVTNNGNITMQQHFAPLNEATTDYGYTQDSYMYDALNRLSSVTALHGGPGGQSATDYAQVYNYDRWGNRTIDQTNTWGANIPKPNFGVDPATNRLTAPAGYAMNYDGAGNLTNDTYTGQGARVFDAENRMKQAWANSQWQTYAYDGNGRRIKRIANGIETWQVYGAGGELLAEYAANASASNPQIEYGYRGGELLITAGMTTGTSGSAFSFTDNPLAVGTTFVRAIHLTELRTAVNQARTRASLAAATWSEDPVQANVTTIKAAHITELRTRLDEARAALGLSAATYTDPSLASNYSIRAVHFEELRTKTNEALTTGGSPAIDIRWLVTDQLGTPRMVFNLTGSQTTVSRHDYLPFGEELSAGTGGRTTAQGYSVSDGVRQHFTGYEHDAETGLEYAQARYYSSGQGRFTGVDPINGRLTNPQTWNRYTYAGNNPLKFIDPAGTNYFVGGGVYDPFIAEFRIDGFVMPPEGTTSSIEQSDSIANSSAQFDEVMSGRETNEGGEAEAEPQRNAAPQYSDWVIQNVAQLEARITPQTWDGYTNRQGERWCAQLPQNWDYQGQHQPIYPRNTPQWQMGRQANWGDGTQRGTVFATFDRGSRRYLNLEQNNHVVVFLSWYETKKTTGMLWWKKTVSERGMWALEQGPNFRPRGRQIAFNNSGYYFTDASHYNVVQICYACRPPARRR